MVIKVYVQKVKYLHPIFSCTDTCKTNCHVSPGGTGVLWWLYAKQRRSPKETVIPEQLQIAEDNLRALLIYAISATVFTVSWVPVGRDLGVMCM